MQGRLPIEHSFPNCWIHIPNLASYSSDTTTKIDAVAKITTRNRNMMTNHTRVNVTIKITGFMKTVIRKNCQKLLGKMQRMQMGDEFAI